MLIALGEKRANPRARFNGVLELPCFWSGRVFIEEIHPRLVANSGLIRGIQSLDEATHHSLFPQWLLTNWLLFTSISYEGEGDQCFMQLVALV